MSKRTTTAPKTAAPVQAVQPIARPGTLPITIAKAINNGRKAYDAAPIGQPLDLKVREALSRVGRINGKTFKVGAEKLQALAILKACMGRAPKTLPNVDDLKKTGDFKVDCTIVLAVQEWATVEAALATLASLA
jgi:hypothetical protein